MRTHPTVHVFRGPAALLLVFGLTACGGGGDKLKPKLHAMENQLTALQADQDRLEERLEALELRGAVSARAHGAPAAEREVVERPRLKVIRLSPEDPAGPSQESVPRAVPERAEPEPENNRPVIRGQGDRVIKEEPEASHEAEERTEYEALLALAKSRDYERAIDGFRDFVKRRPRGPYSDNALYWIAECELGRGDVDAAMQRFDEVIDRYPYGNKAAAAGERKAALARHTATNRAARFGLHEEPFKTADASRRNVR